MKSAVSKSIKDGGGAINITRSLMSHPAFKPEDLTEREAWIWLLMQARYKPEERRLDRFTASLERGQLMASVRYLAECWGPKSWSKSRVARFLDMLKKRDMVDIKSGTGVSIITICKYDDFQNTPNHNGTVAGHEAGRLRDSSGTNIIKEIKEIKDKEPPDGVSDLFGEEKPKPKKRTARDILGDVATVDQIRDILEMRRTKKLPVTERAMVLLRNSIKAIPEANRAVSIDAMILKGWSSCYPVDQSRAAPPASGQSQIPQDYFAQKYGGENGN
jgi:hypothetical protein